MEHHHRVETSVNEISRHLAELTGFRGTPTYAAAGPGEVYRIALNPFHAKQWLGWAPQTRWSMGCAELWSGFEAS